MPDEPQPNVEAVTGEAPPELRPFEDVLADLNRHLETAPDAVKDALRSHPVVSGLSGQIAQTLVARQLEVERTQAARMAVEAKEAELLQLAEDDPEAFSAQFRSEKQAEIARKDLERIRLDERKALAEHMSRANSSLPEWKELSPAEQSKVAQALIGVPDDQIFAVYQGAVVDVVADKRADKRTEERMADRVKAEREAWETEQAAAKAKGTPAPSIRSGAAAGNDSGEPSWPSREWDQWYEERHLRRRPVAAP